MQTSYIINTGSCVSEDRFDLWVSFLSPNTTAPGLLARDREYFWIRLQPSFGSLARGAELTAGSGALWSGLIIYCLDLIYYFINAAYNLYVVVD